MHPIGRAVVLVLSVPLLAYAIVACSGSSSGGSGGGGGPDATEESSTEAGPKADGGDASSAHDGSSDGDAASHADSSLGDASDGAVTDADTGPPELSDAFAGDCGAGPAGEPLDLSCTGLYSDFATKTVAATAQPYAPGLLLWSDGATKQRWIELPPGKTIDTSNMDEWTFPVGTKIWKEFSLPIGDASTATRIETRLLWKQSASTWYRTTYRWSDDGKTSATELTTGDLDAGGTGYEVPDQGACAECHNGRIDGVLGFEAVSLAAPAASGMTLSMLEAQHLLTAPPATPPVVPGNAVESAALGWMHANCGTACHNAGGGAASFTGFYMRLDVATLASVQTTDTYTTGWNVETQDFYIPDAATSYRLHACDLSSSCAYYRPDHRDGVDGAQLGTQMPPLDTHAIDEPAVAQIAAWINQGCGDGGADQ